MRITPSETDVAPKAISGRDGMGWEEISGQGYAKSTFGANNRMIVFVKIKQVPSRWLLWLTGSLRRKLVSG